MMADSTEEVDSPNNPLIISPNELVFPPPLNRVITNILKLKNTSANPIGYKVKTTAPKRYCVRPNTGLIPPGDTIEVQVLLNYIKDKPQSLKCKDKFQVQTLILPSDYQPSAEKDFWANTKPEDILKQKLKCYFTRPVSSSTEENKNKLKEEITVPSFTPTIPKQLQHSSKEIDETSIKHQGISHEESEDDEMKEVESEEISHLRSELNEKKSQFDSTALERNKLLQEVTRLKAQILAYEQEKENTLRQRKIVESNIKPIAVQQSQSETFPADQKQLIIFIAVIALLCFLLGKFL